MHLSHTGNSVGIEIRGFVWLLVYFSVRGQMIRHLVCALRISVSTEPFLSFYLISHIRQSFLVKVSNSCMLSFFLDFCIFSLLFLSLHKFSAIFFYLSALNFLIMLSNFNLICNSRYFIFTFYKVRYSNLIFNLICIF